MTYRYVLMIIPALLMIWLGSSPTHAATAGGGIYVSPNGSGSCSPGSPCSLNTGLALLQGGGTLILQGGTYNQRMNVPGGKGGSSDGTRTIIRVDDGATVRLYGLDTAIDGQNPWLTITGQHGTLIFDGQYRPGDSGSGSNYPVPNLILQDFEITGSKEDGWLGDADNGQFLRLNIHHNGIKPDGTVTCCYFAEGCGGAPSGTRYRCHGIYTLSTNAMFDGNQIWANEGAGIHRVGANCTIRNNKIFDNYQGIIETGVPNTYYNNVIYNNIGSPYGGIAGGRGSKMYNNTIVGNSGAGLFLDPSVEARNNILLNNGDGPVVETGPGSTFSNNLCHSTNTYCALATTDPRFVNAAGADFHLGSGSPAIDAGTTLAEVTTDLDLTARPAGGAFDIGAYEAGGTTPPLKPPVAGKLPPPTNFRIVVK
jgi:hypothetical protein